MRQLGDVAICNNAADKGKGKIIPDPYQEEATLCRFSLDYYKRLLFSKILACILIPGIKSLIF